MRDEPVVQPALGEISEWLYAGQVNGQTGTLRVLIVEHSAAVRETVAALISREGCSVEAVQSAAEALVHLETHAADVIVADVHLPGSSFETLRKLVETVPQTSVVLTTAAPTLEDAARAISLGAFDYLSKPIQPDELVRAVRAAAQSKTESLISQGPLSNRGSVAVEDQVREEIAHLRKSRRNSERFSRQETLILRLGSAIGGAAEAQLVYRAVYAHIRQVMDTAIFIISSLDPGSELIRAEFVVNDGEEMEAKALPPIPLAEPGRGNQSQVIRTREARVLVTNDETKGQSVVEYTVGSNGHVAEGRVEGPGTTIRSAAFLPMTHHEQVLGVLQVQSYWEAAYSEDDVRLLQSMSNVVAAALAQAT